MYFLIFLQIHGIQSQLHLTKHCRTLIVMPCTATFSNKSLVYPQYWRSTGLVNDQLDLEIDGITFTGTKPKLMVAMSIAISIRDPTDTSNPLFCSSLFTDACDEKGVCICAIRAILSILQNYTSMYIYKYFLVTDSVYLELSLENVTCNRMKSSTTVSMKINVDSIKAFALNDKQQAFILSGPETHGYVFSFYTIIMLIIL